MDPRDYLEKCGVTVGKVVVLGNASPIPLELIAAIVEVESGGKPHAMRYEKNYRWLYKPSEFAYLCGTTLETEKQLQKFSYGLMQVMGAVAREECPGLSNLYRLLNPDEGVAAGVRLLEKLYKRHDNFLDIISAYNQGSPRRSLITGKYKNQKYVDKVVAAAGRFGLDLL